MSAQFTRDHVKISVAKILHTLGWHSINTTPLEILTDILHNYLFQLSKLTTEYSNEFGYTKPNLDHLGLAFREMGISLVELEEYVKYVNFGATPAPVSKFPVPKEDQLNFLKPGSKEVVTRPVHIHEHLPPMNPILEGAAIEKETSLPEAVKVEEGCDDNEQVFKKPPDVPPAEFKKSKREEEGSRPTREISSVMMTTSGFLSPAREGKLPEAKTPLPPPTEPPPLPPPTVADQPNPEQPSEVIPIKKPSKPMRKAERKRDKVGKELFKVNHEDRVKKSHSKLHSKLKQMKAIANTPAILCGLPHGLDVVKLPPIPQMHHKIHPVKCNNKALQAARMKTEKLNTTITPLPMKPPPISNIPIPSHPQMDHIDKLLTVPDKKKVNILRKISNVKDKLDEKGFIKKEDLKEDPSSPHALIIDEPEDMLPKLAHLRSDITIEPINPPNYNDNNIKVEPTYLDSPPGTPSTPKTPELLPLPPPIVIKEKKKRKPKIRKPKPEPQPLPYSSFNEAEAMVERPKTPKAEVDLSPHQAPLHQSQTSEFPFGNLNPYHLAAGRPNLHFLANFGGPGLIPPPLGNPLNPLFPAPFPLLNLPDFGQHPYLPQNLPSLPNPLANFLPKIEEIPSSSSSVSEPISLPPPRTPEPVTSTTVKPEKKSKEHKKDKKDKLKKKAKKEKLKAKAEKKEEKKKIKKEKREKRKEKESKEEATTSSVPKLTLKLKSPSPRPVTPDTTTKKIIIKPVVKKEPEELEEPDSEVSSLAKISALVTGPPKPKNALVPVVLPAEDIFIREDNPETTVKPLAGPGRPRLHPVKAKPLRPKKKHSPIKKQWSVYEERHVRYSVMSIGEQNTEGYDSDAEGKEVWICPACCRQDDGSPMIGCDGCDAWYHWVCVGIQVPPDENEDWYCRHCLLKKDEDLQSDRKKKRKRREKKEREHQ